jgi:L,D-peptidoglycan transpeptidase YkuD (ErfK/YbiS/YcfS/YnhG family)
VSHPLAPIDHCGWCDDVRHRNYNRLVRLPFEAGHERMWRTDQLYDAVVIIDHNTTPTVRGRGSAIFLHVAKPKAGGRLSPTEGCVAMPRDRIRLVLRRLERCTRIVIH